MKKSFSSFKGGVSGEDFIGRENYLKELMDMADADQVQHISLYGLPHVGKTSIQMEFKKRLEKQGCRIAISGRRVLLLIQTVQVDVRIPGTYGYTYLLRCLLRNMLMQIAEGQKIGNLPENDEEIENLKNMIQSVSRRPVEDAEEGTQILMSAIRQVGKYGVRTVLLLDEFERAGQYWTEEEYLIFMTMLLNRALDLFCVVASRPHISYVLSNYVRKVSPFRPYLVSAFSDEDMLLYFERLQREVAPEQLPTQILEYRNSQFVQQILYYCGHNPYLLSLMAAALSETPSAMPAELFRENKESYFTHFDQVIKFMLYEEEREQKSFSHVVKCYFNISADYQDIIMTYSTLGYIELNDADSLFSLNYGGGRFVYTKEGENKIYYFTTVCPAFIMYLYVNELDHIKDVRDLLTGLIYSIRDITKRELSCEYGDQSWNEALLLRMSFNRQGLDYYAAPPANPSQVGACWTIRPESSLPNKRKKWIRQNREQIIHVAKSSLEFAVQVYNKGVNQIMPVLDPINITDNGKIIASYPGRFQKYFTGLDTTDWVRHLLHILNEVRDARNEISHFSRYGMTQQEEERCRNNCILLLRSIYSYLGSDMEK